MAELRASTYQAQQLTNRLVSLVCLKQIRSQIRVRRTLVPDVGEVVLDQLTVESNGTRIGLAHNGMRAITIRQVLSAKPSRCLLVHLDQC